MSLCNPQSIFEWMKWGEEVLDEKGRPDSAIDAKLLMKYVLAFNETQLLLERQKRLDEGMQQIYKSLIEKRSSGIPLQQLTGTQEFMGLEFQVNEHVLIPRQDTETLIEELLEQNKTFSFKRGIDIGTGSGCISITLAYYIKELTMCAIDISEEALKVARHNIEKHDLEKRLYTLKSDVLENYAEEEKVDLIVSNPPYISKEEVETLMIEVIGHEPREALTDEGDGLSFYKRISKAAKSYLKKGGVIAYEIGYNQGKAVTTILKEEGYSDVKLLPDLSGNDRVITARWFMN